MTAGPTAAGPSPATSGRTTILIAGGGSGGHLMPALAIAETLRRRHPDWRIVLIGARRGLEAKLLPARDFPFQLLPFEPIYRRQWWRNLGWPWLAIRLIRAVRRTLAAERPAAVLGTGGYASAPLVWGAARAGIPTAILEQDAFPGFATRRLAPLVNQVYLSVPETTPHLKPGRDTAVFVTGSPITPAAPEREPAARARFRLPDDRTPTVLVFGGSQGALAINRAVAAWIDGGIGVRLTLLWATGPATYPSFQRYHAPPAVQVFPFLDPIADAYAVADLAVARAGMMTIAELSAWGIPSILVPLPTAAADHQTRNARALESAGAAVVLLQASLDGPVLGDTIRRLLAEPDRLAGLAAAARSRARPDAAIEIASRLEALAGRSTIFSNS